MPLIFFVAFSIWLSVIDLKTHRLPNKIVLVATILIGWAIWQNGNNLLVSIKIGIYYFLVFLVLWLSTKKSLGLGDVKYSICCGLVVGYYLPEHWIYVLWLMFALAALTSLFLIWTKRLTKSDRIAFGPFMALAVTLAVLNSLDYAQL